MTSQAPALPAVSAPPPRVVIAPINATVTGQPPPPPPRPLDRMEEFGFVGGSVIEQERAVKTSLQPLGMHSYDPQADDDLPAALGGSLIPTAPSRPLAVSEPPRMVSARPMTFTTGVNQLELDAPRDYRAAGRAALAPQGTGRLRGSVDRGSHDEREPDLGLSRQPMSEVEAVARYGPIPNGLVSSAIYALKVGLRRMEISSTLTRLVSERSRAAAEADRALITLGHVLYQQRHDPRIASLGPEIERVMAADQTLGERNAAHQDARWEVVDELATLDQVVADTSATIEPIREHETNLQRMLDQLQDNSKRTQARMQRVEIQIRGLHASAEMSDDPELLPTLEAERRVREQELQAIADQVAQVRQALGEARRELAAHLGTLEALHEDRKGRQRALQQKDDIHKSYAGDAIDAMTYALRLLAHAALEQGMFMVAEAETRKAESAVQRLKDRDRDETLHKQALDSYDVISVRKGVFVIVVGTILTLIALRMMRHLG